MKNTSFQPSTATASATANRQLLLPLLLLLLLPTFSNAQDIFQKTYDHFFSDRANTLEVMPDGRMVLAGGTALQNSSQQNMLVLMLNEKGEILWAKTYSNGLRLEALDILRTKDGGLLIAYDAFNASGEAKASWMKINPVDGAVVWSRRAIPSQANHKKCFIRRVATDIAGQ